MSFEKELSHYPLETFKDKVIYCPMDVATTQGAILRSEFVHYFQMHAHELQFKELIVTCLHDKSTGEGYADDDVRSNNYHLKRREVSYATQENKQLGRSPIAEVKNEVGQLCYKYIDGRLEVMPDNVVNECILDTDGSLMVETEGTPQLYHYQGYFYQDCKPDEGFEEGQGYGSGDFRSQQCCKYLEQADIVVTNPPFSLFREFVNWIMGGKKFIILGNKASTTYANIFKLFRDKKCRLGYSIHSGERYFIQPDTVELSKGISVRWFTNLFFSNDIEKLILLSKKDNEDMKSVNYQMLDNYDALNVGKYKDIPSDYDKVLAVPVSFFDFWNPEQFEILGLTNSSQDLCYCKTSSDSDTRAKIDGKAIYARVLIRHCRND